MKIISLFFSLFKRPYVKEINKTDYLFLCDDVDRQFTYNGLKYSQFIDTINEYLINKGRSTLTIAKSNSIIDSRNAYGNVILQPKDFYYLFLKNFFNKNKRINKKKELWREILVKINPAYIIGIQPDPILCIAAKECNIKVIDVQHGVISNEGYYDKNSRLNFNNNGWPDYILCWDRSTLDFIKSNRYIKSKGYLSGNLWINRFQFPLSNDDIINFKFVSNTYSKGKRNILISLQWNDYSKIIPDIPDTLVDIIKETHEKYQWHIKVHPLLNKSEKHKQIKLLSIMFHNYNVEWKDSINLPLPYILSKTNLHITSHSAVTKEAEAFGVKTGLWLQNKNLINEYFSLEIKNGSAEIIEMKREKLNKWIKINISNNIFSKDKNLSIQSNQKLFDYLINQEL